MHLQQVLPRHSKIRTLTSFIGGGDFIWRLVLHLFCLFKSSIIENTDTQCRFEFNPSANKKLPWTHFQFVSVAVWRHLAVSGEATHSGSLMEGYDTGIHFSWGWFQSGERARHNSRFLCKSRLTLARWSHGYFFFERRRPAYAVIGTGCRSQSISFISMD